MSKGKMYKVSCIWVPYNSIPANLIKAVIATEDPEYFSHCGFDWVRIKRAAKINLRERRIMRGASTISQQLAKNLFLSPARTFRRKLREAVITVEMEFTLGKSRILEIYLNIIEWGDGIFGAEAAARYYFGVSANALTDHQAAFLAAIISAPRRNYKFSTMPAQFRRYLGLILSMMEKVALPKSSKLGDDVTTPTHPADARERYSDHQDDSTGSNTSF